jgi:hypothetical protein
MKFQTVLIMSAALSAAMMVGCSASMAPSANGISPQHPPVPRANSPLPLSEGNQWIYSYSDYDSAGNRIVSREPLELDMPGVYGLTGTTLTRISWQNYQTTFPSYVYEYEWEQYNEGYLLAYRNNAAVRGLYILGQYKGTTPVLYDSAVLWLAYPAAPGKTWELTGGFAGDSAAPATMEVVSNNEPYYYIDVNASGPSKLKFFECYLYKESIGDSVTFYYYHEDVGALGYLMYVGGKLRQTYLLQSFTNTEMSSRYGL